MTLCHFLFSGPFNTSNVMCHGITWFGEGIGLKATFHALGRKKCAKENNDVHEMTISVVCIRKLAWRKSIAFQHTLISKKLVHLNVLCDDLYLLSPTTKGRDSRGLLAFWRTNNLYLNSCFRGSGKAEVAPRLLGVPWGLLPPDDFCP